jgi:2-C-methyl-D-erythritol 4-phosphate cytidylyltransferase
LFAAVAGALRAVEGPPRVGIVPVLPVTETVRARAGGVVDRGDLVVVQTPQAFFADALRAAHASGAEGTDDASLVEAAGGEIALVPGDPVNLKITYPTDLMVAEALLP